MTGHELSDELAEPFHAVPDERVVLAIDGSGIHAERVLNVAFKDRLLVEGHCVGLVRFGHGPSFQGGSQGLSLVVRAPRAAAPPSRLMNSPRLMHGTHGGTILPLTAALCITG
jgi:hypothetical protein